MAKRPAGIPVTLPLDARSGATLQRQVYDGLRAAILAGRLRPGTRLPSTRSLAADLAVARNTVTAAFGQLVAEGYAEARVGAGTVVARALPDDLTNVAGRLALDNGAAPARNRPRISRRGRSLSAARACCDVPTLRPFQPGWPALDQVPLDLWWRLAMRVGRRLGRELLGHGDPAGYPPLRKAIAEYVAVSRGVRCADEQVVVTSGSQQALFLAAQLLLDPGDAAWVEDPAYPGTVNALRAAGARLVPIPVDAEGIDVRFGEARQPAPRVVAVTPSHQYPLGVTMTLARRLELLRLARRARAWVLEDDYDSEFRYSSRPIPALQGLDQDGRVIYLGTFSKTLFPALRLGYAQPRGRCWTCTARCWSRPCWPSSSRRATSSATCGACARCTRSASGCCWRTPGDTWWGCWSSRPAGRGCSASAGSCRAWTTGPPRERLRPMTSTSRRCQGSPWDGSPGRACS